MQIGVITNPNSRRNKNRPNRAAELQSIVGAYGEVHETASPESIKPVLREFLRRRARFWVADGGDGSLHWMIRHGLDLLEEEEFRGGGYELPLTLPTGGGTINFVTKRAGIHGRAERILQALRGAVEAGARIEEVEVDSMRIEGTKRSDSGEEPFRTYGFAVAAGGVGQRFYDKYYQEADPNPWTIVKIVTTAVMSMPLAYSPLRHVPGLPFRHYARDLFEPCRARVAIDGVELSHEEFTGIHVASMSLNLGGVFRFFDKADQPGQLHCLLGACTPFVIARNIPNMHLGREIRGEGVFDQPCRELTVSALGPELLSPIIDGEAYSNLKTLTFKLGPRLRIPKVI
jgi:diacylglycerol kinase family enzyme